MSRLTALALLCTVAASPLAAHTPCVGDLLETDFEGATDVVRRYEDVQSAQVAGSWQEGRVGSFVYRIASDHSGMVANEVRSPDWRIDVRCDATAGSCEQDMTGWAPEAARELANEVGKCILNVPPPSPEPEPEPEPVRDAGQDEVSKPEVATNIAAAETPPNAGAPEPEPAEVEPSVSALPADGPTPAAQDTDGAKAVDIVEATVAALPNSAAKPARDALGGGSSGATPIQEAPGPVSVGQTGENEGAGNRVQAEPAAEIPPMPARTNGTSGSAPDLSDGAAAFLAGLTEMNLDIDVTVSIENGALSPQELAPTISSARPTSPADVSSSRDPETTCAASWPMLTEDPIRRLQLLLADAGFDPGQIDGRLGSKTRSALISALGSQAANLTVSQAVSQLTIQRCRTLEADELR